MAPIDNCHFIHKIMNGFNKPWAIAGGWATDLFLGRTTRTHDDIEIMVFRNDQLNVQDYLHGWCFKKVDKGKFAHWEKGEMLNLPIHEAYAENENEKIEILLNERDTHNWVYRRDHRIRRDVNKAILFTDKGIPFLSPEIVLLYKSKHPRPKDEQDFRNVYKHMSVEQKSWLREALNIVYAKHDWIELLN